MNFKIPTVRRLWLSNQLSLLTVTFAGWEVLLWTTAEILPWGTANPVAACSRPLPLRDNRSSTPEARCRQRPQSSAAQDPRRTVLRDGVITAPCRLIPVTTARSGIQPSTSRQQEASTGTRELPA